MTGDVLLRRTTAVDAPDVARVHRLSRATFYGVPAAPDADDGRDEM
jgi:hypothetical protein